MNKIQLLREYFEKTDLCELADRLKYFYPPFLRKGPRKFYMDLSNRNKISIFRCYWYIFFEWFLQWAYWGRRSYKQVVKNPFKVIENDG